MQDKFPVRTNVAPNEDGKWAELERRINAIERQLVEAKKFRQQLRAGLLQAARECEEKKS